MTSPRPNFDVIARPYRWLEYLTLGRRLERCRTYFLPRMAGQTSALVLGDGDGRFIATLLAQNPALRADAVDSSAAMLRQLEQRCRRSFANTDLRLRTHHGDALSILKSLNVTKYDLVATHFFLDCLTQTQVDQLAGAIVPKLAPRALWLVSEFCIPDGPMRLPAKVLVRSLYRAFRVLTGLRITHLPDHRATLQRNGFVQVACHRSLLGMLTTELWTREQLTVA